MLEDHPMSSTQNNSSVVAHLRMILLPHDAPGQPVEGNIHKTHFCGAKLTGYLNQVPSHNVTRPT